MQATVRYLGGVKFEASTRNHRVLCDQPVENKGTDTGMTPPEFLLVSLGTCAGYYAAEYLRARSLPVSGLEVRVSAEKNAQPARLGREGFSAVGDRGQRRTTEADPRPRILLG